MKRYGSGEEFEELFFGRHSSGNRLRIADGEELSFDDAANQVIDDICESDIKHPDTRMGAAFHSSIVKELQELGINANGFVLKTTIDTDLDLGFESDGLLFLPVAPRFPLTIDLFNIDKAVLPRDLWIDSWEGNFSWEDYQSALYQFKTGMAKWKEDNKKALEEGFVVIKPLDLRVYTDRSRPKSHFIVTPYDAGTYVGRRRFANNVAKYFANKVVSQGRNMAQESHK